MQMILTATPILTNALLASGIIDRWKKGWDPSDFRFNNKKVHLGHLQGGVRRRTGRRARGILDPPKAPKSKKIIIKHP